MTNHVEPFTIDSLPSPEDALIRNDIQGILCSIHSDQRPIKGSAAILDWRLKGIISRFIRAGDITGAKNETVLLPIMKNEHRLSLVILGAGPSTKPLLPSENKALLESVREQLVKLKITRIAVASSSFKGLSPSEVKGALKGLDVVWTT